MDSANSPRSYSIYLDLVFPKSELARWFPSAQFSFSCPQKGNVFRIIVSEKDASCTAQDSDYIQKVSEKLKISHGQLGLIWPGWLSLPPHPALYKGRRANTMCMYHLPLVTALHDVNVNIKAKYGGSRSFYSKWYSSNFFAHLCSYSINITPWSFQGKIARKIFLMFSLF